MAEDRVPQPDTEFDEYINGSADYLQQTDSTGLAKGAIIIGD